MQEFFALRCKHFPIKTLSQKSSACLHPEMCDPSGHYYEAFVVGRSADGERREAASVCRTNSRNLHAHFGGGGEGRRGKKPGLQRGTHTRGSVFSARKNGNPVKRRQKLIMESLKGG